MLAEQSSPISLPSLLRGAVWRFLADASCDMSLREAVSEALFALGDSVFSWHPNHSHLMLGFLPAIQDPRPLEDPMVGLLHLSTDNLAGILTQGMGQLQFFIEPNDLAQLDFSRVAWEGQVD